MKLWVKLLIVLSFIGLLGAAPSRIIIRDCVDPDCITTFPAAGVPYDILNNAMMQAIQQYTDDYVGVITKISKAKCDGTTDDTAVVNSELSSGVHLQLPAGTCIMSSAVLMKSNTYLQGQGMGITILKLKNGVMPGAGQDGGRVISHTNFAQAGSTDQNIEISYLTIDGNSANNPDIAAGSAGGVAFAYATNVRVHHAEVKNIDGYGGIYFGETTGGGPQDINPALYVERCIIRDSISSTAGGSYGAMMFITAPQTKGIFVNHNYGYNNRQGILLEDNPQYGEIIGNIIEKSALSIIGIGIHLNGATNGKFSVSHNKVTRYGRGIVADGNGNSDQIISENTVELSNYDGILIATPGSLTDIQRNIIVAKNIVKNTQAGPGIRVSGSARDITLSDNHSYDDQGTKTQTYGVSIDYSGVSYVKIHDNDLRGNLTGPLFLVAGTGHEIHDNMGYNPVGISTITPSTGVAYTAGASPETIYVYGGTVTDVTTLSTTVATSSPAQVELDPNQSVTFTFSGSPTFRRYIH